MANYINDEILSEAYSHLNIDLFDDADALNDLQEKIATFISLRARFLFGNDATVKIEFEEGSLRTKIKIVGSVVAVIAAAVATHGNFRDAVQFLSKDATLLAESANLEMIFRTKAAHCDRVTIEKRRGVFGRVDELIGELDLIGRLVNDTSAPMNLRDLNDFVIYHDRLTDWQRRAERVVSKLPTESSRACIAAGLLEELEKFPEKAPWVKKLNTPAYKAGLPKNPPNLPELVNDASVQFEKTVRESKKYYEEILKQAATTTA